MDRLNDPGPGGRGDGQGREWGSRRRKVLGYIKAANELRQAYTAQWSLRREESYDDTADDTFGAIPDVGHARSGDEEMVLFPSYTRQRPRHRQQFSSTYPNGPVDLDECARNAQFPENSEWHHVADGLENGNSIVDIDVRGWVYMPQRGPLNRKQRLLVALARKLSGIPAPGDAASQLDRREIGDVAREAQSIVEKGREDADHAWTANFATNNTAHTPQTLARPETNSSLRSDEASLANSWLMQRLKPFMATPLVGIPVTMFFFNDDQSQSRTTLTDEFGHFNVRVSLPFIPTQVRVLASESLSVTEDVHITEPTGVSLISDIDDTIKHSAIGGGAKEIFRNTFARELDELVVHGVKEWYNKLASMGVKMHYVSNSPWQLYPLLKQYFRLAGLPPGSFHLKRYSGMLQGIFEPTAERKRGALEQIMQDFPYRKFILVGDSGEADLEVYTELALAYPGRVLGIFIRDITTPEKKDNSESSFNHDGGPTYAAPRTFARETDAIGCRPKLPPRRTEPRSQVIDDTAPSIPVQKSEEKQKLEDAASRKPPTIPAKPSTLRTAASNSSGQSESQKAVQRKPAPPLRSKPQHLSSAPLKPVQDERPALPLRPAQSYPLQKSEEPTHSHSLARASHSFPNSGAEDAGSPEVKKKQAPPVPLPRRSGASATSSLDVRPSVTPERSRPQSPQPPPRHPGSSPKPGINRATNYRPADDSQTAMPSKREELWKQRWKHAQQVLLDHGVVLGSWRVGSDVQDVTVWLVTEAQKGESPRRE